MSARVLIVDDVDSNRRLLEARLTAEYFDVLSVSNGPEALSICARGACDIVLLDVMMPEMDGFEVCRRLKQNPATHHIPVIMVTGLDEPAERIRGLEAGADDFLIKPIDELALTTRVRALGRLKVLLDELRLRAQTALSLGIPDRSLAAVQKDVAGANLLLVDDRLGAAIQLRAMLGETYTVQVEADPQKALFRGVEEPFDLVIVSLALSGYDALRLCSQFRSLDRTRNLPLIILTAPQDRGRVPRAFDLGVNDYVMAPVEANELKARVRTQLRRKLYADALRENVHASLQAAVVDTLTGLHNRRYFDSNAAAALEEAANRGKPFCLMALDIDHFKRINDTYGHEAGDQILKAFAARVRRVVRGRDIICRTGGEEFVIVMPETSLDIARKVAERVRRTIEAEPFTYTPDAAPIPVTTSVGLADRQHGDTLDALMKRADTALYQSKQDGRNRVTAKAA